jgi:MOSC domain-containing protein YiiM
VFFIGDTITMEIVGECEPCSKMNALQPGLLNRINHRRGLLALVINGGSLKVGDSIRLEP